MPQLVIDLDKIYHNASTLVARLKEDGISVTGVTKAFLGAPELARTMLKAGVTSLGDSRIENIERMRRAGIDAQIMLIRSPMLSQTDRVVASVDISVNTEFEVLAALSVSALKACKTHGVLLMVELGDLREGFMPDDVMDAVKAVRKLPNLKFMGLGTNLACRNGVSPDDKNMAKLSALAIDIASYDPTNLGIISGGNSSNLNWVLTSGEIGQINNLRIGEAILLGREALHRKPIEGLHTDAISLAAEVIESKVKPSKPWGEIAQSAFADHANLEDQGNINQSILALGRQDVDPDGLSPRDGIKILDASSDHLIVNTGIEKLPIGSKLSFQLNYSALLRAMTSPHIIKNYGAKGAVTWPIATRQKLPDAA